MAAAMLLISRSAGVLANHKARPSWPRLFLCLVSGEASVAVHTQLSLHQNFTKSVTGRSRLHIFVRLFSHHYARSIRSPTRTGNKEGQLGVHFDLVNKEEVSP